MSKEKRPYESRNESGEATPLTHLTHTARPRITVGVLAHVDAGKTTLSEALLYTQGELRRIGRVDHGDAFLDDTEVERNRGITVFSKQARFTVNAYLPGGGSNVSDADASGCTEVTLIDTPGHFDFAAEMERSLSVIDYALLVVSGSEGVQAHTRTLHRMLKDRGIPVIMFINKMDIAVRSSEDILSDLADELGCGAVDFTGIAGPGMDRGTAERFVDDITLYSHELSELVLEHELADESDGTSPGSEPGIDISNDAADAGYTIGDIWVPSDADVARAVQRCEIVPCVFGSALRMEGIKELAAVLGRYTLMPEYGSEPAAKIYKIAAASDGSRLAFMKVTGGSLRVRDRVSVYRRPGINTEAYGCGNARELVCEDKISQIRLYSGSKYVTADQADAGSMCAVSGLGDVLPGDAVGCGIPDAEPVIKPFMVYSLSGPEGMDPHDVMKDLEKLAQEDPALSIRWANAADEIEIRIMGQVQLEVISSLIRERYGYDVTFGEGRVLYLETVSGTFEGIGHFEPLRHYAEVHLIVEPGERGSGVVLSSIAPEDELARNWQRLIMTHLEEKEHRGVLTGSPLTDVRITLAAGRAHDKHTSGGDFREATYRAVRNALMQAREAGCVQLLEPWNYYEIELPSDNVGRAMTDISHMGGSQEELEQSGNDSRIRGEVPASEIAGYQQLLTSYTSGRGRLACTPAGYRVCHDSQKIIEESGYDPERDIDNPADSVFVSHGASDIVRWDEVPDRMHIGSVLRKYLERKEGSSGSFPGGSYDSSYAGTGNNRGSIAGMSVNTPSSEVRKRQIAAEKELQMIFEKTYGPAKSRTGREARESRYGDHRDAARDNDSSFAREKSEEERASDELRNQEIKAKHQSRGAKSAGEPERAAVIIDGYNVIHADAYLKDLAGRDVGAARDQLIERLCNYAAYTGNETIVVFDAYNVACADMREEDQLGVRVIFTGEDEPADIRIGKITGSMRGRKMYVVSSDMLVQQDSFEHGALRISSREFMSILDETEAEIRSKL